MLEITCPLTRNPRTRKTRRTVEIETETITEIEGRTEIGTEIGTTETEIGTGEIGVEIETVMVIETGRETAIGTGEMIGRGSPTLRNLWRRFVLLVILSSPVSRHLFLKNN